MAPAPATGPKAEGGLESTKKKGRVGGEGYRLRPKNGGESDPMSES